MFRGQVERNGWCPYTPISFSQISVAVFKLPTEMSPWQLPSSLTNSFQEETKPTNPQELIYNENVDLGLMGANAVIKGICV